MKRRLTLAFTAFSLTLGSGLSIPVAMSAPCTTQSFTASTVDVGDEPRSVAVGDFNLDNQPDLAVANSNSDTVTILLGDGSGGFTGSSVGAGDAPFSVAVGDFNLDNQPDLAVANQRSDNVTILLNTCTTDISPDSAVSKTDSPDSVVVTDHLTYTITVNNAGEADATGVTLTDTLPSSVDFVSVTPSDSCAETEPGRVECDLGDLASGASATVTIVVKPTETGTIINSVTVASVEDDDNPDNNTATADTTVSELLCHGLVPTIVGTPQNDTLTGTNGPDVIHGLGGNDTISGGNDNDVICGGEGNDTLSGNNGIDQLFGENGDDTLSGNNGADALDGGVGNDVCIGGNGADTGANCETQASIP